MSTPLFCLFCKPTKHCVHHQEYPTDILQDKHACGFPRQETALRAPSSDSAQGAQFGGKSSRTALRAPTSAGKELKESAQGAQFGKGTLEALRVFLDCGPFRGDPVPLGNPRKLPIPWGS